ncbi:hypothetical protein ASPZODRAFT_145800 [Penicilliopsis zonata CBS 506.65]|uniref:F-box domain-containing protein n=1 Tax=Penicilliopsis zonata CBS 506.65 TaxID=1073090 RepID=A0A1L9S9K2_9EURO|nr:hypothetical protein ASPZODRAFT_145800 [Penicilliopsis zonata CBS 506.65]OJJ43862.1 hypothetical protein ASPZODRAFT_145800 [Penicilliopsis zonata CBS 506.65]
MLTPIRVRGRRKQPTATQNGDKNTQASAKASPKAHGRPLMSSQSKLASSQSKSTRRVTLLTAPRPEKKHGLSQFERLPLELIERIFLYAVNVNLARASPMLQAVLSSERIYRVLILLAFWNDRQRDTDRPKKYTRDVARIMRPLDYNPLRDGERAALQATVLRCRWCTARRIMERMPDLMRLMVLREGFSVDKELDGLLEDLAMDNNKGSSEGSEIQREIERKDIKYSLAINRVSMRITSAAETQPDPLVVPFLSVRRFPDALLRGDRSFDQDETFLLETLLAAASIEGFASVTLSHDALHHGIHTALVANNARALASLLELDQSYFRRQSSSSATSTSSSSEYSLPAEHFRTAVRVARSDPTLFLLLLRANAESVPADDAEITQWAMDMVEGRTVSKRKSRFGRWLLDWMMHLPRTGSILFTSGRANPQDEMGRRYLDIFGESST